ncbi:hypothetical protein ACIGC1_14780 [Peribacillus butanolivorans]|uniref:hypothetical protein n=1 Tax=Peribacillus butanolivorans TaxID=421767 RepID=UPI0037C824CE
MSKNIDILTEMVAGGFHEADVKVIGRAEDTYIYADSKKNVANNIQRSTTIKLKKDNSKSNFSRL